MKRNTRVICLLVSVILPPAQIRVQAQQRPNNQPAQAEPERVVLEFQVKKKGEFVGGLNKQDISVFEDDVKQEITEFSEGDTPLSIVLLLDLSNSMKKSIRYVRERAQQIAQGIDPGDEVALIRFATDVVLAQRFTTNKQEIANAISQAPNPGGYTTLNEALREAAVYLTKSAAQGNRRVVIVFTDDEDTASAAESLNQASQAILNSGITVCGVLARASSRMTDLLPEGAVAKFVRQTAGVSLFIDDKRLGEQMTNVVGSLHRRYLIEYVPSNPKRNGKFRRLRLRLSPEAEKREGKLTILAREGYFAPPR